MRSTFKDIIFTANPQLTISSVSDVLCYKPIPIIRVACALEGVRYLSEYSFFQNWTFIYKIFSFISTPPII